MQIISGRSRNLGFHACRAVLLRNGRIVPMSVDHRPTAPQEEARSECEVHNLSMIYPYHQVSHILSEMRMPASACGTEQQRGDLEGGWLSCLLALCMCHDLLAESVTRMQS